MANYTAYLNQPFSFQISAFDPDSYPGVGLLYTWTQVSGPDTAIISNIAALTPTFTAPTPGTYVFQLEVTDSITPVYETFTVNVLPLFTASAPYTAYCPIGNVGNPASFTGLASSGTSLSDATSKATTAASVAANASLVCAPYASITKLRINIYGLTQINSSINQLQLSYLSSGTPSSPITETPLAVLNGIPATNQPLGFQNNTICNPNNLLFPYSTTTALDIDDLIAPLSPNGPLYLILRAGSNGQFPYPVPLNLDNGPIGASIQSITAAGSVVAAPSACLQLPNSAPTSIINVSLQQGTFIGFDTSNWITGSSPATYLLVYIPQGSLNNPTGLATVTTFLMDRPSVPALAEVKQIDTFLTSGVLNAPLFLAFFAATYNAGTGIYTPIANSIQFAANTVFSASTSAPPGAINPYSILSMSGNTALGIPAATNGILYFPNPKYARVVAGQSTIS